MTFRKLRQKAALLLNGPQVLDDRLGLIQQALGRIEARQTVSVAAGDFPAAEFKVSSQWGEDGIIEHLVHHVPIERTVFVEFGVQDYREANTRFLLMNRNWSGLVMDGSPDNIAAIKQNAIYWRYNLKAASVFITRENINDALREQGIHGDIGLLSVDIDGNDYFVWDAIDCISPRIVVTEYNALFGAEAAVSVPYDPTFYRTEAHHSNLYWGCSLAALAHVGERKGYALVGCNTNGNNAFFVRRDVLGDIPQVDPKEAFRWAEFRESRSEDGTLTFLDREQARKLVRDLPVVDVKTGATTTVGAC